MPGVLLHIAPEPEVARRLRRIAARNGMTYRGGGITGLGDAHIDILNLSFAEGSIPFIYCCHVMMMLEDDRRAMREVHRVLRPGGTALLQVPAYGTGATTEEHVTRETRLRAFNDPDIWRRYTDADYVHRLHAAGFDVEHIRAVDLPPEIVRKYQLKAEVLHVCRKRGVQA
jgi:SAM-dependent methyltransferase